MNHDNGVKCPPACLGLLPSLTPATEVLEMGGTFEESADILGDTEAIIRKHYAKWSVGAASPNL